MFEASSSNRDNSYNLPHQRVIKQFSIATKFRIIFDTSACTAIGTSLNDNLIRSYRINHSRY